MTDGRGICSWCRILKGIQFKGSTRQTHESWTEETLHLPGNTTPLSRRQSFRDPFTGRTFDVDVPDAPQNRLFRHRTRFYLRRWAWRYFRRLGFQRQKDDCAAGGRPLPDHQPDSI